MAGGAATAPSHGGRLTAARRRFPCAPEPFIDLSTGINPVPYPIGPIPPAALTRLPEPEVEAALLQAAAAAYGAASPELIAAAPGTQVLISLLPRLLQAGRARVLSPTYAEHAAAWRRSGAEITETTRLDALACAGCAVLCNPNNPDGRRFSPAALLALADIQAAHGGLLVVDEAFADFEDDASVIPFLPRRGLLVLRSFGKAYGLAGLRLGFALADATLAAQIRDALGPWAVSGPALALAQPALTDRAWVAAAARRLADEAASLDGLLTGAGLRVVGGTRLFRLAEAADAPARFDRLGRQGILVRAFPERPRWLRFGIPPDPAAWDRLRLALAG